MLPLLSKIKRTAEQICQNAQEILRRQLRMSAPEAQAQAWSPPQPLLVFLPPISHQESAFWALPDYSKVGKENLIRWIILSVSSFHIKRHVWQDWTDSQWLSLVAEQGTPETIFKDSLKQLMIVENCLQWELQVISSPISFSNCRASGTAAFRKLHCPCRDLMKTTLNPNK